MNIILLPLEADLGTFILFSILLMVVIPALLLIIGAILHFRKKKRTAKILFIVGGIWALISLGVCGTMMGGGF